MSVIIVFLCLCAVECRASYLRLSFPRRRLQEDGPPACLQGCPGVNNINSEAQMKDFACTTLQSNSQCLNGCDQNIRSMLEQLSLESLRCSNNGYNDYNNVNNNDGYNNGYNDNNNNYSGGNFGGNFGGRLGPGIALAGGITNYLATDCSGHLSNSVFSFIGGGQSSGCDQSLSRSKHSALRASIMSQLGPANYQATPSPTPASVPTAPEGPVNPSGAPACVSGCPGIGQVQDTVTMAYFSCNIVLQGGSCASSCDQALLGQIKQTALLDSRCATNSQVAQQTTTTRISQPQIKGVLDPKVVSMLESFGNKRNKH